VLWIHAASHFVRSRVTSADCGHSGSCSRRVPGPFADRVIGPQRRWVGRCELADLQAIRSVFGARSRRRARSSDGRIRELISQHGETSDSCGWPPSCRCRCAPGTITCPTTRVSMMVAELPSMRRSAHRMQSSSLASDRCWHVVVQTWTAAIGAVCDGRSRDHLDPSSSTAAHGEHGHHNVRPQQPLYALGREMLEYLPYVPIGRGCDSASPCSRTTAVQLRSWRRLQRGRRAPARGADRSHGGSVAFVGRPAPRRRTSRR